MEKASSIRPSPEAKALYFKLLITGARPKWWAFSGAAIANTTGSTDKNAVASAVKKMRTKITKLLASETYPEVDTKASSPLGI